MFKRILFCVFLTVLLNLFFMYFYGGHKNNFLLQYRSPFKFAQYLNRDLARSS